MRARAYVYDSYVGSFNTFRVARERSRKKGERRERIERDIVGNL